MSSHPAWCNVEEAHNREDCSQARDFTNMTGMPDHQYAPSPNSRGRCRSTWFGSQCDWAKDDPRHTHKEAHS